MADVNESGGGGGDLGIDLQSMAAAQPVIPRPFADACERVIVAAGVQVNAQTRRLASYICGPEGVAGLPFVQEGTYPRDEVVNGVVVTREVDAVQEQAVKLAAIAEKRLDSPMVWTPAATAIALTALNLRLREKMFEPDPVRSKEEKAAEVRALRAKIAA